MTGGEPTADHRPLRALLVANTVSQVGNSFSFLAIPWFVLATTGSSALTGVTVAAVAFPAIVVGLVGGAVVDRLGYRRTSVVSDVASGVTTLLIPLLYATVGLPFGLLLALVVLGAVLDGPGTTARMALYPDLIARARVAPDRANALYSVTSRVAGVLGAPLAGGLIAAFGAADLLWVNAASFAVSALIVRLAVPDISHEPSGAADQGPGGSRGVRGYLIEVAEGLRFVGRDRLLLWLVVALAVGGLVAEPLYGVILPVYANEVFGSAGPLGLILGALGAGSIIGNLVYVAIAGRLSRRAIFLGGFAIRALCFATLVALPPWWVVALAIFIGAVALEPSNPMLMTVMQERVPPALRGRVFGATGALGATTRPVGLLGYGLLLGAVGLSPALAVFALLNLALPLVLLAIPALRALGGEEPVSSPTRP